MKLNTDILNQVQSKLVEFANNQGISLQAEFGTVDEFKRFVIAFTFKAITDLGIEPAKAYDLIFGNGEYAALVERTWNQFNS